MRPRTARPLLARRNAGAVATLGLLVTRLQLGYVALVAAILQQRYREAETKLPGFDRRHTQVPPSIERRKAEAEMCQESR